MPHDIENKKQRTEAAAMLTAEGITVNVKIILTFTIIQNERKKNEEHNLF